MTPLTAATATDTLPLGWLTLAALLWTAGYIAACAVWPFTSCRRCHGAAKLRSPSGRAWRPCPRCAGTGTKLRAGRRAWAATRTRGHQDRQGRNRP